MRAHSCTARLLPHPIQRASPKHSPRVPGAYYLSIAEALERLATTLITCGP
nr:MAG TPA: hypothetical protein [Caudoviricetes sp.]